MEKFAGLADVLSEKFNAQIIFLWGARELEYVKQALSCSKKKHILSDKFDLLELAAFIKKSRLHIGTTSAPMHIATSQNIPTFTIYGQKNGPKNWSPPEKTHGYIQGNLDALTVESVFEKLSSHIKSLLIFKD